MIPSKLDLTFWRGVTFELELIGQMKVYNYNPVTNITPADMKRTYMENLEYYGFSYRYVNFLTDYIEAELRIIRPWIKAGQSDAQPLLLLSLTSGDLVLTNKSVKVLVAAIETKGLEFDSGSYELLLTKVDNTKDGLVHGSVAVLGDKQ